MIFSLETGEKSIKKYKDLESLSVQQFLKRSKRSYGVKQVKQANKSGRAKYF